MKNITFLMLAGLLCSASIWARERSDPPPVLVPTGLSGTVGAITDYVSRGLTSSRHLPALQAGATYQHATGLYGNLWGSTIDSGSDYKNNIELDFRAGHTGQAGALNYDLAYIRYVYPGANSSDHLDYGEWLGKLGYDFGVVNSAASLYWSNNYQGSVGHSAYYLLEAAVPLPFDSDVHVHYGWNRFSSNTIQDYDDWAIGVKKSAWGVDFNLDYTDTHGLRDAGNIGNPQLVLSVIRNF